jgi:hypothetical protein
VGRDKAADNKDLTQRLKMKSIARLLLWVFPFFGIIYILGWRKLLERDGVFVGTAMWRVVPFRLIFITTSANLIAAFAVCSTSIIFQYQMSLFLPTII